MFKMLEGKKKLLNMVMRDLDCGVVFEQDIREHFFHGGASLVYFVSEQRPSHPEACFRAMLPPAVVLSCLCCLLVILKLSMNNKV